MIGDLSESDYGTFDYGDGYYSARPIWLFDCAVRVPVNVRSQLDIFTFQNFTASAQIQFHTSDSLNLIYNLSGKAQIFVYTYSEEYLGPFWEPIWVPEIPPDSNWIPDVPPSEIWVPDIAASEIWVPDVPFGGGWMAETGGEGPWIPRGPDMRPNKAWPTR